MRRRELLSGVASLAAAASFNFAAMTSGAAAIRPTPTQTGLLSKILAGGSTKFLQTLNRASELQIQVLYSRREQGVWREYGFRADAEWFAPASLVKLPLCAFLLADLQHRKIDFRAASIAFPEMPGCAERPAELRQAQRVTRVIERALVLSDDSAYCALYDYFGPAKIAEWFARLGFPTGVDGTRIQARFGSCGPERSTITGPVRVYENDRLRFEEPRRAPFVLMRAAQPIEVGKAWISGQRRIEGAKDFTTNNTMPLSTIHRMMLGLIDPNSAHSMDKARGRNKPESLALNADARAFLLDCMARHPSACQSCNPVERQQSQTDFRLLAVGDRQWPSGLQVRNKVGWAFGYLSDTAHLKIGQSECVVSCVMYLNADGVLNDGRYEYDSIGRPFMAELGRLLLSAS
jgi:hypothetical protein